MLFHVHNNCCVPATDEDDDLCTLHGDGDCADDGTGFCWGAGVAVPAADSPVRADAVAQAVQVLALRGL